VRDDAWQIAIAATRAAASRHCDGVNPARRRMIKLDPAVDAKFVQHPHVIACLHQLAARAR